MNKEESKPIEKKVVENTFVIEKSFVDVLSLQEMVQFQYQSYQHILETLEDGNDLKFCPEIPQEIIDLKQKRELKKLDGRSGSKGKFKKSFISVDKIFDQDTQNVMKVCENYLKDVLSNELFWNRRILEFFNI